MSVVMASISHNTVDCNSTYNILTMKVLARYTYKTVFIADKDLCGQNIVQLQSTVLREMLAITTAI